MNFTLHLTKQCNMDCSYCITEKCNRRMTREIAFAACDLAFSIGKSAGLCFFGGEPLLEKQLIYETLDYCEKKSKETGKPFMSKMTTNGTLLDEAFLERACKAKMGIGMSFDGSVQDRCRRFADGRPTGAVLEEKAKLLLNYLPNSYAMMTIAPEAVEGYADAVRYLYDLGFRRVTATIAYGNRVHWTDADMEKLEAQLLKIASFYESLYLEKKFFYFSPFDSKIHDCIVGYNPAKRCHLGFRQMPVNVDGKIYPCTQFIGDADYDLGDVFAGIVVPKQKELADRHATPKECEECDLKGRCTNSCGCMNRMETGDENQVSALQCTYERMLITMSDELADRMYDADPEYFAKRFV